MFIDLFKDKVETASVEELRKLLLGILMDLEATDGYLAAGKDVRDELLNTFMVYLLE